MVWLKNALDFIVKTLLGEFIIVVFGVLIAYLIQTTWIRWRYGKWHVIVTKGGKTLVNRDISAGKAKEILTESTDKAVFLKGVASPYEWINCDIVEEGVKCGLLVEDKKKRCMIINLDHNPPKKENTRGEG